MGKRVWIGLCSLAFLAGLVIVTAAQAARPTAQDRTLRQKALEIRNPALAGGEETTAPAA